MLLKKEEKKGICSFPQSGISSSYIAVTGCQDSCSNWPTALVINYMVFFDDYVAGFSSLIPSTDQNCLKFVFNNHYCT